MGICFDCTFPVSNKREKLTPFSHQRTEKRIAQHVVNGKRLVHAKKRKPCRACGKYKQSCFMTCWREVKKS